MDERTTLRYIDELQGQIDRLKKMIGGGGGGGSVVINPEGAATADLEKIKSGGIIYGLNYNKNANRPQINGNLLTGNKNSKQLNIAEEMSEAAYAALASKNENEIYFLTQNAPVFTETDTVASSGITWIAGEDPDTYTATLSYSVVDTDTTGVVSVTCDNEDIEIGDCTFSSGSVSVPMVCADPTAITGDIEFVFTLTQPEGTKRIVKNNKQFGGYSYDILFTSTGTEASYELTHPYTDYDIIVAIGKYTGPTPTDSRICRMIPTFILAAGETTTNWEIASETDYLWFSVTDSTHFARGANSNVKMLQIAGIKF